MFAVTPVPRLERRSRHALRGEERARRRGASSSGTRTPSCRRTRARVLLPGGFSYGDYLRCGAMARFSPVMAAVQRFADAGGPVLGTCNGFQVLCEAGLLPGALLRNDGLDFVCDAEQHVRVEVAAAPFLSRARVGQVLRIPIKHGEGRYVRRGRRARAARGREPDRAPLLRRRTATSTPEAQSERLGRQRRRRAQRGGQRDGPDAAPRARVGGGLTGRLRRPRAARLADRLRREGRAMSGSAARADRRSRSSRASTASRDAEWQRILAILGRTPTFSGARDLLGDVVRALLVQVEPRAPEDAADDGASTCWSGRARARAPSRSATGSR